MSYKSDFHIHTYYSDGTFKPSAVVRKFKDEEYDEIAITDHDGTDGVKEAMIAGEALRIKVIPGIEFATVFEYNGEHPELHILGYYIDVDNAPLQKRLVEIREERQHRNEKLLKLLNESGYELTWEDILERPGQTYIGKPNFKRALERKGYKLDDPWTLFDKVSRDKITSEESIALIKGAGGIAVLAHPMKIKHLGTPGTDEFFASLDGMVAQLKKAGLKGLECFHPSANEEESLKLVDIAGKYHLHITKGSDFHTE
jgi:Predicted metal-dependent phosphoesterases (PHP family)